MAAASWFVVFCIAGRVVLAFMSLILNFICGASGFILLTFFIGALLLLGESSWLSDELGQQQQPGDVGCLVILVVCYWLLAFLYFGAVLCTRLRRLCSLRPSYSL